MKETKQNEILTKFDKQNKSKLYNKRNIKKNIEMNCLSAARQSWKNVL